MSAAPAIFNPYGSPSINGMNDDSPPSYTDVDFTYPYDVVLVANQFLRDQAVSTTNDADFCIRAIPCSRPTRFYTFLRPGTVSRLYSPLQTYLEYPSRSFPQQG